MGNFQATEIHLTKEELNKIKRRKIGTGKSGTVYKYNNQYVYKIYHDHPAFDIDKIIEEKIKIYDPTKEKIKFINQPEKLFYCLDEEGVRLRRDRAIFQAMKRQQNISMSKLPVAPIYLNDHFIGCVLQYFRRTFQLHSIKILPKNIQWRILLRLLEKVQELLDNYIYHLDLHNRPDELIGHSNILVSYLLEPHIIDLDGSNTMYYHEFSEKYYRISVNSLKMLILDILYDIDLWSDNLEEYDLYYFMEILRRYSFTESEIDKIIYQDMTIEELKEMFFHDTKHLILTNNKLYNL